MPISEEILQRIANNDPTLETLNLSYNQIGDEGVKAIADALKTNKTLTHLDLTDNQIGDEGVKAIADTLKTNKTLTTLYLANNQIGDEGVKEIADTLKTNKTLTILNFIGNRIEAEGAKEIADTLKTNKTLTTLYLSFNPIQFEGAKAIVDAIEANQTLTALYLAGNQIGDKGAKAILYKLQNNLTLTTLDLDYNEIEDVNEIQKKITKLIYRNEAIPARIFHQIYHSFFKKERGQQNQVFLSEIELKLINTSPESCLSILSKFLAENDISQRDGEELFNHIKEFPGGLRMLMSSVKLAFENPNESLNKLGKNINYLDLSDLFALKGVTKNLTNQPNFSKLCGDLLVKILGYLEIDDIKIKKLGSQNATNQYLDQQVNNFEGEEEFEEETAQPAPRTSITNTEAITVSGCLPGKSCTIS